TRDTVEEKATAGGVLLRLIDTAGIRDASDPVERLGVERARRAAAEAELALLVLDGSRPLTEEDREVIRTAQAVPHVIAVQNKSDLPRQWDPASLEAGLGPALSLSAREGQGLDELEAAIARLFPEDGTPCGEILTNARQAESLSRALASLRGARAALEDGLTPDAVLSDVERAMNALGEVTGQTLREDLTARIFERFCVGK
ncbi:MAG: GTP-binding protein, partial [Oscillospiraceae bacterium]|nr:GTP-binding protein [Oscillospiraceae bacterium]